MIGFSKNVASVDTMEQVFQAYRSLPATVLLDGKLQDRIWASTVGHFVLSEFAFDEVDFLWREIKPWLDNSTESDCEFVYARVLKYNETCHIPRHVDSFSEDFQRENDLSVLIGMVPPQDYVGGSLIIEDNLFDLDIGDAVYYTYEHPHEVKKIKSGVRYVINLRCKMVK
jgi:hypothetical protein